MDILKYTVNFISFFFFLLFEMCLREKLKLHMWFVSFILGATFFLDNNIYNSIILISTLFMYS